MLSITFSDKFRNFQYTSTSTPKTVSFGLILTVCIVYVSLMKVYQKFGATHRLYYLEMLLQWTLIFFKDYGRVGEGVFFMQLCYDTS